MEVTHLFSGSALGAVDGKGRVRLPSFILRELERPSDRGRVMFGVHESDPCLTGYGASLRPRLQAELERRRLRDEDEGRPPEAHHARARRLFGLVEEAAYDEAGRLHMPPFVRTRAGIAGRVLFIGAGPHFELWDPERALIEGSGEVREVAEYRLGEIGSEEREVEG